MTFPAKARRILPIALVLICGMAAAPVFAQNDKTELRTVHGVVVDKNDNPAATSVVYLLNSKTNGVKTSFADDKGAYRFSGLDPNVDYQIHAERDNMASPSRKISSFDSRRDIDLTLKLSHAKGGS